MAKKSKKADAARAALRLLETAADFHDAETRDAVDAVVARLREMREAEAVLDAKRAEEQKANSALRHAQDNYGTARKEFEDLIHRRAGVQEASYW